MEDAGGDIGLGVCNLCMSNNGASFLYRQQTNSESTETIKNIKMASLLHIIINIKNKKRVNIQIFNDDICLQFSWLFISCSPPAGAKNRINQFKYYLYYLLLSSSK